MSNDELKKQLGQSSFDWRIDVPEPTMLDYAVGGLSGAQAGYQFGSQAYGYYSDWGNMFKKPAAGGLSAAQAGFRVGTAAN